MDTRGKIVAVGEVPPGCTVVTGYFDVLLAADTRDLAGLAAPVAAVVLPLEGELLPQRARAELAAALRIIDYVVIAADAAVVEQLRAARVVRLEAVQVQRARELKEHVRKRHGG
jgi:hypothetical protein